MSLDENLYDWCKHNDFRGRKLRFEYDYKYYNGMPVDMKDIPVLSNELLQWKCLYGHKWQDSLINRIFGADCVCCKQENYIKDRWGDTAAKGWLDHPERDKLTQGTSYPEQFLYQGLLQIYPNAKNRYPARKRNGEKIEYDIALFIKHKQYRAVFIEYNPMGLHWNKLERDEYKKKLCQRYNIRLIQIVEDTYRELKETWTPDYICFHLNNSYPFEYLKKTLAYILSTLGHSIDEINLTKVKEDAWYYSHGHIPYNESLLYNYPELAKEWSPKNDIERPDQYKVYSGFEAWWKCIYCGNEWQATIQKRTSRLGGCKKCGYKWINTVYGQPQNIKPKYKIN